MNRLYGAPSIHKQECIRPKHGSFIIPANSYSWWAIPSKELNNGTFITELRYSCVIDGQTIYSKPQTISLDIEFALPPKYRMNDLVTKDFWDDISPTRKIDLLYFKAMNHYGFGLLDEAIQMLEPFISEHPAYYRAYLMLGGILICKAIDSSEFEKVVLFSQAIHLWEQIPEGDKCYASANEKISMFSSFLPNKEPWNRFKSYKNCKVVNGEIYCTSEYLSEPVKIRFKDQY